MKRFGHLLPQIADRATLAIAFARASRGRQCSPVVVRFAAALDARLAVMSRRILDGTIEVGGYSEFTIFDPKRRVIRAAPFEQRVLHHAILHVCAPIFDRVASPHSHACRPGRGNRLALAVAQACAGKFQYFLKLDVRRYFDSVAHAILKRLYRRLFKDPGLLHLLDRIVDSHATTEGRGLPIGALASQYFANHYLDGFDRWVVEELGFAGYVRFMDDCVVWSDDRAALEDARVAIAAWLRSQRSLEVKPGSRLGTSTEGLPFLSFRVLPHGLLLGQRARKRFAVRLETTVEAFRTGRLDAPGLQRRVGALLAHTDAARCRVWRRRVVESLKTESLL